MVTLENEEEKVNPWLKSKTLAHEIKPKHAFDTNAIKSGNMNALQKEFEENFKIKLNTKMMPAVLSRISVKAFSELKDL